MCWKFISDVQFCALNWREGSASGTLGLGIAFLDYLYRLRQTGHILSVESQGGQ